MGDAAKEYRIFTGCVFFSSRRLNTRWPRDWSSDVCSSDLGDGGRIIVWADDITRFFGSIEGKGAGENGTGGFAEVSGKALLRFDGFADMRGPSGVGTLLLDPRDIIIEERPDAENVGPEVSFGDGGVGNDFYITPDRLVFNLTTADVKLEATRDIFVEDAITADWNNPNPLTLHTGRIIKNAANLILCQ